MDYFISDLHLFHKNITGAEGFEERRRGFADVTEMGDEILKNWNNKIISTDTVHILGELTTGENRVNAYASWDNDKKPTIVYTNKPVNSLEKVVKLGDWLVNIAPNLWIVRDNELMEEFYMEVVVKEEEKGKWE